ncbi:MAG: hypothetical protein Q8Q40_01645 [Methylococcaceae bacterium]|nr:hypothetical protein [Methylococcaceae bacterium]
MEVPSELGGIRVAFSLDTFFSPAGMQELEQRRSGCRGEAKESISPVGAKTGIKINCRDSEASDS